MSRREEKTMDNKETKPFQLYQLQEGAFGQLTSAPVAGQTWVQGGDKTMLDLAATKKPRRKTYSDSTLMNMRKADLLEYIRTLEHNYDVAIQFNEQQASNCEKLLKDVRPVVHGHWILDSDPGEPWRYICSECGEKTMDTCKGEPRAHFCPNCGAEMSACSTMGGGIASIACG